MNEDYYEKLQKRYDRIYSNGSFLERSRNQRLGKMVNKNYEENSSNKFIKELFEKIGETYSPKKE